MVGLDLVQETTIDAFTGLRMILAALISLLSEADLPEIKMKVAICPEHARSWQLAVSANLAWQLKVGKCLSSLSSSLSSPRQNHMVRHNIFVSMTFPDATIPTQMQQFPH